MGYLALWPVPIEPVVWSPPEFDPSAWTPTGTFASASRRLMAGGHDPHGHGPEDVDIDAAGRLYAGLHDGRVVRFDGDTMETFVDTRGRPLGLHWDSAGNLLVADSTRGLLRVNPAGTIEVLATDCGGKPLTFTDDLETTVDGAIWFTDATARFRQPKWKEDLFESGSTGRLCRYDDVTRQAVEVASGLAFANGVAVDPAQQFVLVNETWRYRVVKVWIAGEKAGTTEVLIDNLPGFPDGISTGTNGVFWIAIASPRKPLLDAVAEWPFARKVLYRLPKWMQPQPERTARAIAINAAGEVVHDLFDPDATSIALVTSVQERAGRLYFGSLTDTAAASMPWPPRLGATAP